MFVRNIHGGLRLGPVRHVRALHRTSPALFPRKDTQDRESMNTESTEYSKSGGDASSANKTAFDPQQTSPEQEMKSSSQESTSGESSNPLNASPANHDISKPKGAAKDVPEGSVNETSGGGSERERTSGGGSAPKNS